MLSPTHRALFQGIASPSNRCQQLSWKKWWASFLTLFLSLASILVSFLYYTLTRFYNSLMNTKCLSSNKLSSSSSITYGLSDSPQKIWSNPTGACSLLSSMGDIEPN